MEKKENRDQPVALDPWYLRLPFLSEVILSVVLFYLHESPVELGCRLCSSGEHVNPVKPFVAVFVWCIANQIYRLSPYSQTQH